MKGNLCLRFLWAIYPKPIYWIFLALFWWEKNGRLVFQGTEPGEISIETGGMVHAITAVKPILSLSEVANKISMGVPNAQVWIKGKGEIGILAESIERMPISVKSAIERLQRKREAR